MTDIKLLKEYIKLLILEAIKDPHFKESELRSIESLDDIHDYAAEYLQELGRGSSRVVYLLSPKKVLKIALNEKGYAQNEAEADVYTSPSTRPVVTKILDYDKDYKWLISELVKPLSSYHRTSKDGKEDVVEYEKSFHDKYNVYFSEFISGLYGAIKDSSEENDHIEHAKENLECSPDYVTFFKAVLRTVMSGNLLIGDVRDPNHWGVAPDRRIVLLDYGFTEEVAEKHYGHYIYKTNRSDVSTRTADGDNEMPLVSFTPISKRASEKTTQYSKTKK